MVKIRGYLDTDYKDIKEILQEADMFDDTWDTEETFSSMSRQDPQSVLVATIDDKVAGVIRIDYHGSEVAFLYRFAVKEEYRGKGVGSQLLSFAENVVKEKGGKEVAFYVNVEKEDLMEYYTKKGYKTSGKKFICMWKSLV